MKQILLVFVCLLLGFQAQAAPLPEREYPDGNSYRVRVEVILEGPKDLVIYRVQIWMLEKKKFYWHFGGGANTQEGLSRLEPDSKLHRADFILVASFLPPEDPKDAGKKVQFRHSVRCSSVEGGSTTTNPVDANTKLDKAIQISEKSSINKLGVKCIIGRIFGRVIEVEAE